MSAAWSVSGGVALIAILLLALILRRRARRRVRDSSRPIYLWHRE